MKEKVNLRATCLKEFWGNEYEESIYLWEGAKSNLNLYQIQKIKDSTTKDYFLDHDKHEKSLIKCKNLLKKFEPIIANKMNEIHGLKYSTEFWKIVFGYWLYRHICVVYDKYICLIDFNINKTSIKLLNEESFIIPYDHYDYTKTFCNDFGVQQLVTQFYLLFAKKKFQKINFQIPNRVSTKLIKNSKYHESYRFKKQIFSLLSKLKKIFFKLLLKLKIFKSPLIVLLGTHYNFNFKKYIYNKSWGRIKQINPKRFNNQLIKVDKISRKNLINIQGENHLEDYIIKTLYYCFPKIFIESFNCHHDVYLDEISNSSFKVIISENWISNIPNAIYCAISKELNKTFICQEHAAMRNIEKNTTIWIEKSVSDKYLTTGWSSNLENIFRGGFCCREIIPYKYQNNQNSILFVGHTRFPYLMELGPDAQNTSFKNELMVIRTFINKLPQRLKEKLIFRPRKEDFYWDVEKACDLHQIGIKTDYGDFHQSILKAKIVIIDHISTPLAEILLMNVPFILLINAHTVISKEYDAIFNKLHDCGIIHYTAESAINMLNEKYDNISNWWAQHERQDSINVFKHFCLGSSKSMENKLFQILDSYA